MLTTTIRTTAPVAQHLRKRDDLVGNAVALAEGLAGEGDMKGAEQA